MINSKQKNEIEEKPLVIDPKVLTQEALNGIIEAFVGREGTDYGQEEISHAEKMKEVHDLIEQGHAQIVYEVETQSVTIVPIDFFKTSID